MLDGTGASQELQWGCLLKLKLCVCFLPQGHAADVFEAYSQLLTEMVLRLPYQIKKIADTNPRIPAPVFDHSWFYFLSEVDVMVCQTLT